MTTSPGRARPHRAPRDRSFPSRGRSARNEPMASIKSLAGHLSAAPSFINISFSAHAPLASALHPSCPSYKLLRSRLRVYALSDRERGIPRGVPFDRQVAGPVAGRIHQLGTLNLSSTGCPVAGTRPNPYDGEVDRRSSNHHVVFCDSRGGRGYGCTGPVFQRLWYSRDCSFLPGPGGLRFQRSGARRRSRKKVRG